ncbi:aldehyde dehydrogenase family protein [Hirsutella rhossiliensis]|uniref:aldehyde dehydrogenase (NAD(+)) n=1 Tax=Hirsutella rhossiliensis TaxID=111463 RepID=A0A9P8N0V6_9HYPO|nr:aldehyde dehydrogenase family domain-containing protein [Hirsutella rhossiliensis]KAH0964800.1 aldehyde dehydrogenase family domain-containing protein [Hirsutella rhossiliensis]
MAPPVVQLRVPNGVEIALPTGLFINNEFVESSSGSKLTSISPIPSNGEEICSVEAASPADIDRAVAAARAAFETPSWRELPGGDRGALMLRLADLIEQQRETLAALETWDNGKPYLVSRDEDLAEVLACLRYYAGWADKLQGLTIPTTTPAKKLAYTLRQPVGVCAQIIPWNYPLAMAAWKLGPALAAGNTVVLKPAEQTPLSILLVADLVRQAGFPPGVVNVVNGRGADAGQALAAHPGIDKIAFTGSTLTGRAVMKAASAGLKNVTLETGGKSPLVVFADADLEQAAKWAYVGIMSNQGQVCTATSRLLVEASVADAFSRAFLDVVRSWAKVGDPFSEDTTHGPQVSRAQYDKILAYIDGAKQQGAKLEMGGESAAAAVGSGSGFFIQPTVFSAVTKDMDVFRDEVFGPLVTITPFADEAEALRLANDSMYGLAAAVFSQNIERAHRVAAALQAGMVWINSSNDSDIQVPFGGVKQSGIGRELGEAALAAYTETKAVHINLGSRL